MKSQEDYLAEWQTQLASAKRQLGYFEAGKMRWKVSGVDRSDAHIATLKKVIASIEKLLEAYGVEPGS
jgi:hypothetical protein